MLVKMDYNYFTKELLEGVECHEYQNISSFTTAIKLRLDKLHSGHAIRYTGQYMVVTQVAQHELANIEQIRNTHYKGLRFTYLNDTEDLIIKIMPSAVHEIACDEFAVFLWKKIIGMELDETLTTVRSTTFRGRSSSKEADAAFKPVSHTLKTDWLTLVFECGVTESYTHLKADAHWWLENSSGSVKIVLLFLISESKKSIHLEQWERITLPDLNSIQDNSSLVTTRPTKTQQVNIIESTATGPPFIFDFNKIFLRQPVDGEGNIIFSTHDLERYARKVWLVTQ
ncbi:hypothetical protein HOY80DRAFT_1077603 [Tuber brumale]|nr:hypothetical protein HOY80DRAFT_1077603 [Tuber brumale]